MDETGLRGLSSHARPPGTAWNAGSSSGWPCFHPTRAHQEPQDGFFVAARIGQQALARGIPELQVVRTPAPPEPAWNHPAWRQAASATLVRGRIDADIEADNIGFPADVATEVRLLQDDENLYAAFRCVQPEAASEADSVEIAFFSGEKERVRLECQADGTLTAESDAVRAETSGEAGAWFAFMTLPRTLIEPDGNLGRYRADLNRTRGSRHYIWSPGFRTAPWHPYPMSRRGEIDFRGDR